MSSTDFAHFARGGHLSPSTILEILLDLECFLSTQQLTNGQIRLWLPRKNSTNFTRRKVNIANVLAFSHQDVKPNREEFYFRVHIVQLNGGTPLSF